MILEYNRTTAIEYAKRWAKGRNQLYPDLSLTYGNNISFLFQCLVNGGLYRNGSSYLDYSESGLSPVISRMSSFFTSLEKELKASRVLSLDTTPQASLNTGDLAFVYLSGGGVTGLIAEKTGPNQVVFYSNDPAIVGGPLPVGEKYIFSVIPNLGEY